MKNGDLGVRIDPRRHDPSMRVRRPPPQENSKTIENSVFRALDSVRRFQDAPRRRQDGLRRLQEASRRLQDGFIRPQDAPRRLQDAILVIF